VVRLRFASSNCAGGGSSVITARRVQRVRSWQVMRDPAGLLFCVLPDPPGTLHEGNAHRWP
jgi:hypothetical protein